MKTLLSNKLILILILKEQAWGLSWKCAAMNVSFH